MNHRHVTGPRARNRLSPLSRPATPAALHAVMLAVLAFTSPALRAGAQTDGTAGAIRTLSGQFTVPQALGTLSGANLFHSFQRFGVSPGESATFRTTSPALQNVIARVTGGASSTVNGPLRLDAVGGGRPNLFLINPAGITFGAGSSVDVPGAFHLSTANYLKFADGSVYRTDLAAGSSFSAAAPTAFGFVGNKSGAIVLHDKADLIVTLGRSVSVTGADIRIGTDLLTIGGELRITAVGETAAEVGLTGPLPPMSGRLVIDNGAQVGSVNFSSAAAGEVAIAAGDIVIGLPSDASNSGIISLATSADAGGAIRIDASRSLTLQNGGKITSSSDQPGTGGDVQIKVGGPLLIGSASGISAITTSSGSTGSITIDATGDIVLDGGGATAGAFIGSETASSGASGAVTVSSGADLKLINGGKISSSTFGAGSAGSLKIAATNILLDNQGAPGGTGLASNSSGSGQAGNLGIRAASALTVINGASISSSTFGVGQAGVVNVHAGAVLLDSRGTDATGIVSESGGTGNSGSVTVMADADISVRDAARISSTSFQSGTAGSVTVAAGGAIALEGSGALNSAGIGSNTFGPGAGGMVTVSAGSGLSIINGGKISSSTFGVGQAGSVNVAAASMLLDNQGAPGGTGIVSETGGAGHAGSVMVAAETDITIRGAARISSSSFSAGNAGGVKVSSATLSIEDTNPGQDASAIASITRQTGNAGSVDVTVSGHLSIADGIISTSSQGSGQGGTVTVQAGSIEIGNTGLNSGTGITANTSGSGNAGNLTVTAATTLSILNGGTISSSTLAEGKGGAVSVNAGSLLMDGRGSVFNTSIAGETYGSGNGGTVQVTVRDHLAILDQATISSSAYSSGNGGQVQVNAGSADLDNRGGAQRGGIGSVAFSGSGAAGGVEVSVRGALTMSNGAEISANTATGGAAGSVRVDADSIALSSGASINSGATVNSTGRTGDVIVLAGQRVDLDRCPHLDPERRDRRGAGTGSGDQLVGHFTTHRPDPIRDHRRRLRQHRRGSDRHRAKRFVVRSRWQCHQYQRGERPRRWHHAARRRCTAARPLAPHDLGHGHNQRRRRADLDRKPGHRARLGLHPGQYGCGQCARRRCHHQRRRIRHPDRERSTAADRRSTRGLPHGERQSQRDPGCPPGRRQR